MLIYIYIFNTFIEAEKKMAGIVQTVFSSEFP